MDQKAYWIAFNIVPGIGPARLETLIRACGSIEAAWKASIQQIKDAGLDKRTLENLLEARRTIDPQAELERVARAVFRFLPGMTHNTRKICVRPMRHRPCCMCVATCCPMMSGRWPW